MSDFVEGDISCLVECFLVKQNSAPRSQSDKVGNKMRVVVSIAGCRRTERVGTLKRGKN